MKRIALLTFLSLFGIIAFAAFPVETNFIINETNTEVFKLDVGGFIIGIFSFPFLWLFGLPLLLLFVKKKYFRKSLVFGWIASLILIILIVAASLSVLSGGLLLY